MTQFMEILPNRGVDNRPSGKDWMMVPAGQDNFVRLVEGAGFDVQPADPKHHITVKEVFRKEWVTILKEQTATISKEDRLFRVHGTSAGPATIIAKKGNDEIKIEVSVKSSTTYLIAYYFLQDTGSKGTRSTFSAADTDG
jgi:hypothetical protein